MNVLLTSFGIEHFLLSSDTPESPYFRMPPVSLRNTREEFLPDYALLLLCERLVMDAQSYELLAAQSASPYGHVAHVFSELMSAERIQTVDFCSTLRARADFLQDLVKQDLSNPEQWRAPLEKATRLWDEFQTKLAPKVKYEMENRGSIHNLHVGSVRTQLSQFSTMMRANHGLLKTSVKPGHEMNVSAHQFFHHTQQGKEGHIADSIRSYLMHVNANLVLAHDYGVGFHDWLDFMPFYDRKFASLEQARHPVENQRSQLETLFTVSFPELAIRDTSALLKALDDKRIADLRALVDQAARGEVAFDQEFARAVLLEVFQDAKRAKRWRSVLGYATLPLGFIPLAGTVIQKVVEESVGTVIERKSEHKHRWFYMLSDITEPQAGQR